MRELNGKNQHKLFINENNNAHITNLVVEVVISVPDKEFSDLSASTLANSFKIERTKLSRLFKQEMGITLEDFIHKEKMNRAAFLLRTPDITVKEVSKRIGFCSCDYFIRKFKEFYGIRPGCYKTFKKKISLMKYQFEQ